MCIKPNYFSNDIVIQNVQIIQIFNVFCLLQGGVYILQLIDWYAASVSLMFLLLLEVIVLAWIYSKP